MGTGRSTSESSERLRAFLAADWRRWLALAPEMATSVGHPGFNDRWSDDSIAGIEERQRQLKDSAAELGRIDPGPLDDADRLNYDLYARLLETAKAGLAFGDDAVPFHFGGPRSLWMPMTQLDGIQVYAADTLDLQPRRTVAHYRDLLSRLERLPTAVAETMALLADGERKGYTPPRIALRGLPDQVRALVPDVALESALLKPFGEFPVGIGERDRADLVREAVQLYDSGIAPSMRRLGEFLVGTYLPACRETVGARGLPDGERMYAFRVKWQTTTDLTPREIHEVGLREVERIRSEMGAIAKRAGYPGDLTGFLRFLRTDPRFGFAGAEELVDAYRALGKKVDPLLARLFGRLPRLPYGVVPVPSYRAPSSPAAYYIPGSNEGGRAGYFYVNTYALEMRSRWEMQGLLLHEAVPGHHLQLALAGELTDLPEFRRWSGETAFVEGWALYAESLGEELDQYQDPYSKFGQLSFDAWRSARLVIDTGLHALGWSRDRALQYFRENTGLSEQEVVVEVDRYIVWPGQALAYKVGQLKIRELRTWAERELGDRFDLRDFHDVVLAEGGLPLPQLEARVRSWVEATRSKPTGRRAQT